MDNTLDFAQDSAVATLEESANLADAVADAIIAIDAKPDWNAKDFCRWFVVSALGMACVTALLNFIVNPYSQYPTHFLEPLVQTSRMQKVALLSKTKNSAEALVLGSSRVMKFEPDYLKSKTGLNFFNGGMNYVRPEDCLAFLRHFRKTTGRDPTELIVGVDVVGFSDAAVDSRLLQSELASFVPEASGLANRPAGRQANTPTGRHA